MDGSNRYSATSWPTPPASATSWSTCGEVDDQRVVAITRTRLDDLERFVTVIADRLRRP